MAKPDSLIKKLVPLLFLGGISVNTSFGQAETQNPNHSAGTFWKVRGNTGTNSGTNYFGTSDSVDLVIKTNSIERMRISADGFAAINAPPTANDNLYVFRAAKGPNLSNINAFNGVSTAGNDWSQ